MSTSESSSPTPDQSELAADVIGLSTPSTSASVRGDNGSERDVWSEGADPVEPGGTGASAPPESECTSRGDPGAEPTHAIWPRASWARKRPSGVATSTRPSLTRTSV